MYCLLQEYDGHLLVLLGFKFYYIHMYCLQGEMNGSLQEYDGHQRVLLGFQFYYTPVLVLLGTVGNTLSVFVFFSTKLRKLSSSYYLSALAISDTGFLAALFISWLNLIDVNLFNMPGICQLTVYLTQVTRTMYYNTYT